MGQTQQVDTSIKQAELFSIDYVTCFIREVNASFGKPYPIANISATTWTKIFGYTITLNNMHNKH